MKSLHREVLTMASQTYTKVTEYKRSRFFEESWESVQKCFINEWIPAQQRAADAGLAPAVISYKIRDKCLILCMQKIDGRTLLEEVEEWFSKPRYRQDAEEYLCSTLTRVSDLLRGIIESTGSIHPDWASRNILVDSQGKMWAIDFENWYPEDISDISERVEEEMESFRADLAQSFNRGSNSYNYLVRCRKMA